MNDTKKSLRIFYIVGYTLTAIMTTLTIILKDYFFILTNGNLSSLAITIPVTCICFIASTITLILTIAYDYTLKHKQTNHKHKNTTTITYKTIETNDSNQRHTTNKNIILKTILIILYTLSALLILTDIILINIPLINIMIIPLEITLAILSIILLIIATKINKSQKHKQLLEAITNINREN